MTLTNELHPSKAPSAMRFTEDGIVMLANESQYAKARSITVTDDEISTLAKELHPSKAEASILITEGGMVTLTSALQSFRMR